TGFEDENGNPRMIKSPWFEDAIPFVEAAEIGTEKVIKDHSTIGIVVTTDGSIGEIKRSSYLEAEEKVINELKEIGKPFIVILNSIHPTNTETVRLANDLSSEYSVPVMPISAELMNEKEIMDILKTALYEFPVLDILVKIPEWVHILPNNHEIKVHYLEKIKESVISVEKVKDVDDIMEHFNDSEYISKSYISELDAASGVVTINLESPDELYTRTLNIMMGETVTTKAGLLKMFSTYKEGKEELDNIKTALKMAKSTGYGIVYPTINELKLETPELVKQGSRYGVKLKAVASSIHLMKVDVESTFEPIIGSELQSKELINYLMKDYEKDASSIWKSEIFGRSLEAIVQDGIQAKLSMMPNNTRYKLKDTVTKIVNKGSNTLIAIVI
ncbi:MAG: stage IV sporulation protein A, partial [Bacilli bacterium]